MNTNRRQTTVFIVCNVLMIVKPSSSLKSDQACAEATVEEFLLLPVNLRLKIQLKFGYRQIYSERFRFDLMLSVLLHNGLFFSN